MTVPTGFVTTALATLHLLGATPVEKGALRTLAAEESHLDPTARNGMCCGLWQTWMGSEEACQAVMTDPVLAAAKALLTFRQKKQTCGRHWQCCWRSGENSGRCKAEMGHGVRKQKRVQGKILPARLLGHAQVGAAGKGHAGLRKPGSGHPRPEGHGGSGGR